MRRHTLFAFGNLRISTDFYLFLCIKRSHAFSLFQHLIFDRFLNRYEEDYASVLRAVERIENSGSTPVLSLQNLQQRLKKDVFTEERVLESILHCPALVHILYEDFCRQHRGLDGGQPLSIGYSKAVDAELKSLIKKNSATDTDILVFESFLAFNQHVLQSNFFQATKVAFSFLLDPKFLSKLVYSQRPYGIYFVIGAEFQAFHVRFADIARGGVRIVKSGSVHAYMQNVTNIFDEVYSLALTQQRKNKDIPEGGAKAVILLCSEQQDKSKLAFRKFIDAILDLLIPNSNIVDFNKKPVNLFFGPDEGSAIFMDWAAEHAKKRGYKNWKAFSTGKSPHLGGIPHDKYGMTSLGVNIYVRGVFELEGWDATQVSIFQTGGPDGDLGSNNIKLNRASNITSIVDSSGVLSEIVDECNHDFISKLNFGCLIIFRCTARPVRTFQR
jgi:glutamate dehydrogenase